jgi:L-alanine-DL-glutamate epimerase-like enolase superfamily enzyme
VGLAATLHFIAAFGTQESYAEVDANPNPLREAVWSMKLDDGVVTLGAAPGIGVEPDLVRLRPFAVAS